MIDGGWETVSTKGWVYLVRASLEQEKISKTIGKWKKKAINGSQTFRNIEGKTKTG